MPSKVPPYEAAMSSYIPRSLGRSFGLKTPNYFELLTHKFNINKGYNQQWCCCKGAFMGDSGDHRRATSK